MTTSNVADALRKALLDWEEVTENACQDWPEAYAVIDTARDFLAASVAVPGEPVASITAGRVKLLADVFAEEARDFLSEETPSKEQEAAYYKAKSALHKAIDNLAASVASPAAPASPVVPVHRPHVGDMACKGMPDCLVPGVTDLAANARALIAALDQPFRYPGEIKAARDRLEAAITAPASPAAPASPDMTRLVTALEKLTKHAKSHASIAGVTGEFLADIQYAEAVLALSAAPAGASTLGAGFENKGPMSREDRQKLIFETATAAPASPSVAQAEPVIRLGFGKVEVAEGWYQDVPALIFGRNGTGLIGEATQPNRELQPGEGLATVTFTNTASVDVVIDKLNIIRSRLDTLPSTPKAEGEGKQS